MLDDISCSLVKKYSVAFWFRAVALESDKAVPKPHFGLPLNKSSVLYLPGHPCSFRNVSTRMPSEALSLGLSSLTCAKCLPQRLVHNKQMLAIRLNYHTIHNHNFASLILSPLGGSGEAQGRQGQRYIILEFPKYGQVLAEALSWRLTQFKRHRCFAVSARVTLPVLRSGLGSATFQATLQIQTFSPRDKVVL